MNVNIQELIKHKDWLNEEAQKALNFYYSIREQLSDELKVASNDEWETLLFKSQAAWNEYIKLSDEHLKLMQQISDLQNENKGRPKVGTKRSVSLTLPDDAWLQIDALVSDQDSKLGSVIRDLVLDSLQKV